MFLGYMYKMYIMNKKEIYVYFKTGNTNHNKLHMKPKS